MKVSKAAITRKIRAFVDHPLTNLVKGIVLVIIGISEASETIRTDLSMGKLRVGHGVFLIGLFSILESLPHVVDGLEAGEKFLELQDKE